MLLYHGTSKKFLKHIEQDGVNAPSYWGTLEQAQEYASGHGEDGVILVADLDTGDLKASAYVAQAMYDAGDLDEMPDEDDLDYSLEHLGGITCHANVYDATILDQN